MLHITSECKTVQPQTLLILRLRLLSTALPQTTPPWNNADTTLVLKGELSSLPALLPAETGQRQV